MTIFSSVMYEAHHEKPEMQETCPFETIKSLDDFYQCPVKLFNDCLYKRKKELNQSTTGKDEKEKAKKEEKKKKGKDEKPK
jgi:hypothetical protein